MDEDLQHDPNDIELLIDQQVLSQADVVYGEYETLEHSNFRNLTSRIVKKLLNIALPELNKSYSAFRLIKAEVAKETLQMHNSYTFLDGYLTWITSSFSSVIVSHRERYAGESSYNFTKLINHLFNIIFTFSKKLPVKVLTFSSILMIVFSIFYSCFIF